MDNAARAGWAAKILFAVLLACFSALSMMNVIVFIQGVGGALKMTLLSGLVVIFFACVCYLTIKFFPKLNHVSNKVDKNDKVFYCAVLFILTYTARMVWIITVDTPQYSDYQLFYWVADQIGRGYETYYNDPYFSRWAYQMGFPAFMSVFVKVFKAEYNTLVYINALFEAGGVLCIFSLLARRHPPKAAFALSCLYLLMPFPYMLVPVFTNQLAATFFMLLSVCVIFSRQPFTVLRGCAGIVLAAVSNLLRPEGVVFLCAMCAVTIFRLLDKDTLKNKMKRALRMAAGAAVYAALGVFISLLFMWTNLSQYGTANNFHLYKFVVGLNEDFSGQYSKPDTDMLIELFDSHDAKTRDGRALDIVKERLSIGPTRLGSLFVKKAEVIWTDKHGQYPALTPFADDRVIRVLGVELQVQTIKTITKQFESVYLFILFGLCAYAQVRALLRKTAPAPFLFLSSYSLITFVVFLFVEVQRRYSYMLLPVLFCLAMTVFEKPGKSMP